MRIMGGRLRLACVLVALASCLTFATAAHAQTETGKITGRVTDDQGAVLPGVTVTATASATQVARTTSSDASGNYVFANVPPAEYQIKTELSGFRTIVTKIIVTVGATVSVDAKMPVGG